MFYKCNKYFKKQLNKNSVIVWCIFFFIDLFVIYLFIYFLSLHMEVPGGSNQSCSRQPTPEPQQHGIRAESAIYTTAHSNARSLTHWARPEIEPASSWMLVGFVTNEPQWELPVLSHSFKWWKWKTGTWTNVTENWP